MKNKFSPRDLDFLAAVGISTEPTPDDSDGTVQLLEKHGIPVTRENYIRLSFASRPPAGLLDGENIDGELLAELPDWLFGTDEED
jgi:hypothetical protein